MVLLPGESFTDHQLSLSICIPKARGCRCPRTKPAECLCYNRCSQECLRMPNYCNRCSTGMSPLPYLQTPGNMWAARCGHVAQLKDPQNFDQDMLKVQDAEKTCLHIMRMGWDGFKVKPTIPCLPVPWRMNISSFVAKTQGHRFDPSSSSFVVQRGWSKKS